MSHRRIDLYPGRRISCLSWCTDIALRHDSSDVLLTLHIIVRLCNRATSDNVPGKSPFFFSFLSITVRQQ